MAEITVHDRVVQAVQRDAELLDQLLALKEALHMAKQAEDAVRKSTDFSERTKARKEEEEKALAEAQALYDKAVARGQVPFNKAKAIYDTTVAEAQGALQKASDGAKAEYEVFLGNEKRTLELQLAEARATVHRAQQEIAALQTTIDQHRRGIQERLGINLTNLMG